MSDYIFYSYLVVSALTLVGMLIYKAPKGGVIVSMAMFLGSFYILQNYMFAYMVIGSVMAFIIASILSFSEAFKSKNNFLSDVKDVLISAGMILFSCAFWMQIICINLYVNANNLETE